MTSSITYSLYNSMAEQSDDVLTGIAKFMYRTPDNEMESKLVWMRKRHNLGVLWRTNWFEITASTDVRCVIGYCFFFQHLEEKWRWYFGDLHVLPRYRNQSVATNMIRMGLDAVRKSGGRNVYSYIYGNNTPSINLHTKLGFTNLGILVPFAPFIFSEEQVTFELHL